MVDDKSLASDTLESTTGVYDVGAVEEFEIGVFKIFELTIGSVGVVRTTRGFHAVRNRCPHMGAPICRGRFGGTNVTSEPDELEYGFREDVIRCPWHGFEFHVSTGEPVYDMVNGRLIIYDVAVDEGRVLVSRRRRAPSSSGTAQ